MSKTVPLDRRDAHPLLELMTGGFGAAVAVGIVAVLSVCAAFFIYRSFADTREKDEADSGDEANAVTGHGGSARRRRRRGRADRVTAATEKSGEDGRDLDLSDACGELLPPELRPEEPSEKEESTDQMFTDADLDQLVDDKTECDDEGCVEDACELLPDQDADPDETSETESARETLDQKPPGLGAVQSEACREHADAHPPLASSFECCCLQTSHQQPWIQINQSFLGFQVDTSIAPGLGQSTQEKSDKAEEMRRKKNEISIMDAIMDDNEWLSAGPPELPDLPWLAPPPSTQDHAPVRVSFRIHYVTHSSAQMVAVTGNLLELGAWESYVPLQQGQDGFWAETIALPAHNQVQWKFVLAEAGKISRWEERANRHLVLGSQTEQLLLNESWGE